MRLVMVNGKNLGIGDNLWQFLKSLKDEERFDTYFWIDQICIDQSDNEDKSEQVGRMARIYNDAKETIIWLGREDQGQDGVAALIKRMAMATATPKPTSRVGHANFRDPALARLLEHSYWTRIWIIQEIMYSRKIYIKCGQQLATWQAMTEHLARVCRIGNRGQVYLNGQFNDGQISRHVAGLLRNKAVWGVEEAWKPPHRKVHLWWLLRDFEKCQCSNRRDMIYGLRGLTKDVEHLEVDYGISLISFCLKVMKTIIKWDTDGFYLSDVVFITSVLTGLDGATREALSKKVAVVAGEINSLTTESEANSRKFDIMMRLQLEMEKGEKELPNGRAEDGSEVHRILVAAWEIALQTYKC